MSKDKVEEETRQMKMNLAHRGKGGFDKVYCKKCGGDVWNQGNKVMCPDCGYKNFIDDEEPNGDSEVFNRDFIL